MADFLSAFFSRVMRRCRGETYFRMEASGAGYDPEGAGYPPDFRKDRLEVLGTGGCFLEILTLLVTPSEETEFEHIRVEFAKKRFLGLARANPEEIRVVSLLDTRVMGRDGRKRHASLPEFSGKEDGSGGYDGRYSPGYRLPAGGKLRLEVGYRIDIGKEGQYRIVFRRLRNGKTAGTASMRVVFRNREPIDA